MKPTYGKRKKSRPRELLPISILKTFLDRPKNAMQFIYPKVNDPRKLIKAANSESNEGLNFWNLTPVSLRSVQSHQTARILNSK